MNDIRTAKSFIRKQLTPSERTVLQFLLAHGPAHGYRVYKEGGLKTNKTVYVALKSLHEEMGFLTVKASEEEKRRPGQPMKVYYPTLDGLCVTLKEVDGIWKDIDVVAEKWQSLLPLFKYWELFKEQGLSEYAIEGLQYAMLAWADDRSINENRKQKGITHSFMEYFAVPWRDIETKRVWNKVLHWDSDLRRLDEKVHKEKEKEAQGQVKFHQMMRKRNKMLDNLKPDWYEIDKLEGEAQNVLAHAKK